MTGNDRRVLRTRRAIQRSLLRLLETQPMDRVTVTQLAEAADINRKTFYAHYREVGEVLEDVEDEVVGVFSGA